MKWRFSTTVGNAGKTQKVDLQLTEQSLQRRCLRCSLGILALRLSYRSPALCLQKGLMTKGGTLVFLRSPRNAADHLLFIENISPERKEILAHLRLCSVSVCTVIRSDHGRCCPHLNARNTQVYASHPPVFSLKPSSSYSTSSIQPNTQSC